MFINKDALKTTTDVDNAARELARVWGISFPPAPNFDGKKKNKLRDVICRYAGYENGYKTFLSAIENEVKARVAFIDTDNDVIIGGKSIEFEETLINEDVFYNEMVMYRLEERSEIISNLISWIAEGAKQAEAMQEDMEMLMQWDDEYIWSSIETNEYVSPTQDPSRFNEICEEVLKANESL